MTDFAPLHTAQGEMKRIVALVRQESPNAPSESVALAISTAALEQVYLLMHEAGITDEIIGRSMLFAALSAPLMFSNLAERAGPLQ